MEVEKGGGSALWNNEKNEEGEGRNTHLNRVDCSAEWGVGNEGTVLSQGGEKRERVGSNVKNTSSSIKLLQLNFKGLSP